MNITLTPKHKKIIAAIIVVVIVCLIILFMVLGIYWAFSATPSDEFLDLVDLVKSKL